MVNVNTKKDILSREDVIKMVDTFYSLVRQNELIGPIFTERIQDNWPVHLEKMYNFWENILFGTNSYQGRPFPPHLTLSIGKEHFQTWLSLFHYTVDLLFEGENAEEAKKRAGTIAQIFLHKINQFNSLNIIPPKNEIE